MIKLIVKKNSVRFMLLFSIVSFSGVVLAGEIRVAVASNFFNTIKKITNRFEHNTGHKIILAVGSTGKHYAQIKHGAPFDIFFAADVKRPKLLEEQGITQKGSRFTYAIGKLLLWSPTPNFVDANGKILNSNSFRYLAIANPKLAPYGRAAEQVMKAGNVWNQLQQKIVRGENISQTLQFVQSGNAELGFVAYSQLNALNKIKIGSLWEPPQSLYNPIKQQVVLLQDNDIARAFLLFIKTQAMRKIIQDAGYRSP